MSEQTAESRNSAAVSAVEGVVRPILDAHGLELFDISLRAERGGWTLRVVIDTAASEDADAAVSVDQCADVSRDLSTALDVTDPLPGAYTLEVSSPGVERPLRRLSDYVRFRGRSVKITLHEPAEGVGPVVEGMLVGVDDNDVLVDTTQETSSPRLSIPVTDIKRANLVLESPGKPKKSGSKKKRRSSKGRRD